MPCLNADSVGICGAATVIVALKSELRAVVPWSKHSTTYHASLQSVVRVPTTLGVRMKLLIPVFLIVHL